MITAKEYFDMYLDKFDRDFFEIREKSAEETKYEETMERVKMVFNDTEKLNKILLHTNEASAARYMASNTPEVILANLIMQILTAIEGEDADNDLLKLLAQENIKLEDALESFEFYKNNPYKDKAEKKLAELEEKKRKRQGG